MVVSNRRDRGVPDCPRLPRGVGRFHASPPAFRVADEPDGPPELRALSFRPLADEGERLLVSRESVTIESRTVSASASHRHPEPDVDPILSPTASDGEDPAALAFTLAPPAADCPRRRRPQLNNARASATPALIGVGVVIAIAAFAAGR